MKATQEHINQILNEHFADEDPSHRNAKSIMYDLLDFIPIPDEIMDVKLQEGPELEMMVQEWMNGIDRRAS